MTATRGEAAARPAESGASDPKPTAVLVVDLDALARNYAKLRGLAAPAECAAVVKADAYGLGLGPVALRLFREGCRRFFVATEAEGLALRGLLPDARTRIYVFGGPDDGAERAFREAGLVPVLNSLAQIERWVRAGPSRAVLHVDTGMSRLGLSAADVGALAARRDLVRGLDIEYVMTHLACADEPAHALNGRQIEAFDRLRRALPAAKTSIGNSAGILLGGRHCGDLVRPGIGLYGGNPLSAGPNPMEPVVRLEGRVLQIREVTETTTVGYGATYSAEPPSRLAVVGVGYADGYPRCLGNRCAAAYAGTRLPVVGRVSMDLLCLDASALPPEQLGVGDYVELLGPTVGLDEVAAAAGTISYEVLTGLGRRIARRYVGSADARRP
ncbi:MAG TPA: alanine racemase [Gammaproteobacteria bacterium]|nr:alanine racemase [Gammaproteobacteria bacterium]